MTERVRGLALLVVVVLPDWSIVASRIPDHFVMPSIEVVHLVAFAIERGNRLLVFVPVLVRRAPLSFSRHTLQPP